MLARQPSFFDRSKRVGLRTSRFLGCPARGHTLTSRFDEPCNPFGLHLITSHPPPPPLLLFRHTRTSNCSLERETGVSRSFGTTAGVLEVTPNSKNKKTKRKCPTDIQWDDDNDRPRTSLDVVLPPASFPHRFSEVSSPCSFGVDTFVTGCRSPSRRLFPLPRPGR